MHNINIMWSVQFYQLRVVMLNVVMLSVISLSCCK